ncbi:GNAT family N-acetyltransferase [Pelagibius sp.]|uniref:GNAT family N-acetyltransferase n=1 Tax=Pelagibius sp. TaxID=1931238 RepID=UPI00263660DB|nr:GNAT family N-acetyltransferase [Pelagibius sp.]
MARWSWPDPEVYLKTMPRFAAAFGGAAFSAGSACIAEGGKAAALWLPPDAMPDGAAIEEIFAETVAQRIAGDVAAVFALMDDYHPRDRPCWYLPLIAADPTHWNTGLGSAILTQGLARCDAEGCIAYLEGTSLRNVALYQRFDFRVIGKIQAGSSPILYPMIREPKP